MAIYNAYCDRVPVYIVLGNILDVNYRRGNAEWVHSVQDAAAMVRDYTKWDDTPVSLSHFAESAVRAYKISMTPPVRAGGAGRRRHSCRKSRSPKRTCASPSSAMSAPPQGDSAAVAEAAKLLVAAENPVIVAGPRRAYARRHRAPCRTGRILQARVQDQRMRMNFPSGASSIRQSRRAACHPTSPTPTSSSALEAQDLWGITHKMTGLNKFGMESHPDHQAGREDHHASRPST